MNPQTAFPPWKGRFTLGLIVFSFLAALFAGLIFPTEVQTSNWFKGYGFYGIFGTFFLWLSSLPILGWNPEKIRFFLQRHGLGVLLAVLLIIGAVLACPPRFRVLADETNLLGIASAMYDRHQIHNPTQQIFYY